jgi:hypothetical protein
MKKIFLLFSVLLPFSAMAQRHYDPILVEGRTWVYDKHHYEVIDELTFQYKETVSKLYFTVMGDTVINGKEYRKVYRRNEWENRMTLFRAFREEGSHVYCHPLVKNGSEFQVLEFDQSLFMEVGVSGFGNGMDVVDSIVVNGRRFCRHRYLRKKGEDASSASLVAVEGIGFINTGFLEMLTLSSSFSDYSTFRECYDGDELIFRNTDFRAESASGICPLTVSPVRHQETLFDLQGRRLKEAPQKGLYIEEGRKKVVSGQKK